MLVVLDRVVFGSLPQEGEPAPSQVKRRVALNKANRKKGTYGNGDGMDVSHKRSGKTVLEKASTNRRRNGRNGKSKYKK